MIITGKRRPPKTSYKTSEAERERARRYRVEHPDYLKEWHDAHPDYDRERYIKQKDIINARNKAWRENNYERDKNTNRERYRRKIDDEPLSTRMLLRGLLK